MKVFIDSNIYLNFYALSNEDLEELNKLRVLIKNETITLYLTDQVEQEFNRNRELKLFQALKEFDDVQIKNHKVPNMAKNYASYAVLKEARDKYLDAKNRLKDSMLADISTKNLKADHLISGIFFGCQPIYVDEDLFARAKMRAEKGIPPGKKDSYGDQINWECLLSVFPHQDSFIEPDENRNDLHIISSDGDYFSVLEPNKPKDYLLVEWAKKAQGKLFVYKTISEFTKTHFPEIKLASDLEKFILFRRLRDSNSYRETHYAISSLSRIKEFSLSDAEQIVETFNINSQIYGILNDEDVCGFLLPILETHASKLVSQPDDKFVYEVHFYSLLSRLQDHTEDKKYAARILELQKNYVRKDYEASF